MVAESLLFAMHTTYSMVARSPRHPTPGRTLPGRTVKAKGSSPHLPFPVLATIYYVWVDFISIAIYYQLLSSFTTLTVTDVTAKSRTCPEIALRQVGQGRTSHPRSDASRTHRKGQRFKSPPPLSCFGNYILCLG